MFPPNLFPTISETAHRILIIDDIDRCIHNTTVVPKLVLTLLKEKFEVVLISQADSEILDICNKRTVGVGTFSYYMPTWMKLENILRIHIIDSIIHMTNISNPHENVELFKFSRKYGVKNFIMSVRVTATIRDDDDDENDDDTRSIASVSSVASVDSEAFSEDDDTSNDYGTKQFVIIKYDDECDEEVVGMHIQKLDDLADISCDWS